MFLIFHSLENIILGSHTPHLFYLHVTGMVSFGASVIISNLKVLSFSHSVSVFQTCVVLCSYLFYVLSYTLYDTSFKLADVHLTFNKAFTSPLFYLANSVLIALTSLVDIAIYVSLTNDSSLKQIRKQQKLSLKAV